MSGIAGNWLRSFVAENAGFFVLGWFLFGLMFAFPHWFVWLWSVIGWTVTATRAAGSSMKAAVREVLAEQASKPGAPG